jgi:DNA-directed RNA polymerase
MLFLDTKDLGFNTLTEEFNRMYTDRLSHMKEELIQRYKAYVELVS